MMAATGTPLVAMDSGRVRLNWHYLGGRQVYIYADKRVVRDGVDVAPDAFGGSSGEFTVFTFLRESNPDLPLGAEPSHPWPSGPCVGWEDLGYAWLVRIDRC